MTKKREPSLDIFVKAVVGKKVLNPVLLDVKNLTSVADAFLICSGRSSRQVMAIAEHVKTTLKKQGIQPLSVEGQREGHWILMDYGYIVIHIFFDSVRQFYDLEGLWIDAKRIRTKSLKKFYLSDSTAESKDV
ncbi:MAG: ribosome silencing factor [Desulfobacterales bacterium]|nr:ribosome silencing factor [Desulfobacterales bacterium]MDJ0912755.1 ribosome silencing factor [Desulfobacterales bacterium]